MSDQVRIALIGAGQAIIIALIGMAAGIVVALLNTRRSEKKVNPLTTNGRAGDDTTGGVEENMSDKRPFTKTRIFIWFVAPLAGAALALAVLGGLRVFAASPATKVPFCIHGYFYPSGFMNDLKSIQVVDSWKGNCHAGPTCVKIIYAPSSKQWAGMYWQYPDSNWGDQPGRKIEGAKKLVFWARGENGGETIDFLAGGSTKPDGKYQDSFEEKLGTKTLTTDWQPFEINLERANTSSVIGAFGWTATKDANPKGITFYLDGICFQ